MKMTSQLTARLGGQLVAGRQVKIQGTQAPAAAYALRRASRDVSSSGWGLPGANPVSEAAAIMATDRAARTMLNLKRREK